MTNIFTYGSLMYPEVWRRVVHGTYDNAPSRLAGYRRMGVTGEEYPVIIATESSELISGIVYFDVSAVDLFLLDGFEGAYYERRRVTTALDSDPSCVAEAYVLKDEYRHIANGRPWSPEYFERHGIQLFMERYAGFGPDTETGSR